MNASCLIASLFLNRLLRELVWVSLRHFPLTVAADVVAVGRTSDYLGDLLVQLKPLPPEVPLPSVENRTRRNASPMPDRAEPFVTPHLAGMRNP